MVNTRATTQAEVDAFEEASIDGRMAEAGVARVREFNRAYAALDQPGVSVDQRDEEFKKLVVGAWHDLDGTPRIDD